MRLSTVEIVCALAIAALCGVSTPAARAVDCNSNGIDDAQDIAAGTSQDCNANSVPDECDWWDSYGGHFYTLVDSRAWQAAEAAGVDLGGHLTTIDDADENNWLLDTFGDSSNYGIWIGLYQDTEDPGYSEPDGAWKWIASQADVSFVNWDVNSPNEAGSGDENCGMMWGDEIVVSQFPGQWNDFDCAGVYPGIIEMPDCNTNGIPDGCDLDCGTACGPCDVPGCGSAGDCNSNGVPDECDWHSYGGHVYALTETTTWQDAEDEAVALGAHLVTVNEDQENEWLLSTFSESGWNRLWLGYNSAEAQNPVGPYEWIGEQVDPGTSWDGTGYDNWDPGEPNNIPGEYYVEMYMNDQPTGAAGTWNNAPDSGSLPNDHAGILEAPDCNTNGVPDACEPDFDGDGLVDDCDPDIDSDGVLNPQDACDYGPLGAPIDCDGRPRGDMDGDCDIDLADYAVFEVHFTGPNL
ncbi:MAG: hypothetical protein GY842_10050 [bacterium]|nr:hypothetical protein [bacterium]